MWFSWFEGGCGFLGLKVGVGAGVVPGMVLLVQRWVLVLVWFC